MRRSTIFVPKTTNPALGSAEMAPTPFEDRDPTTDRRHFRSSRPRSTSFQTPGFRRSAPFVKRESLWRRTTTNRCERSALHLEGPGNLSQDAWYWRFVEFGTVKMPARPFLRPAFEGKKREAVQAIKTRLSERIEQALQELKELKK